jgi:hypothetical protein
MLDSAAVNLLEYLPAATNPCGQVTYGVLANTDEYETIGRVNGTSAQNTHSLAAISLTTTACHNKHWERGARPNHYAGRHVHVKSNDGKCGALHVSAPARWSAPPTQASTPLEYTNQTLRLITHTSIGGSRIRVRISNTFGAESLFIGAAHVAIRNTGASILPNTDRTLSFSGRSFVAVPVGGLVLSDPVDLHVAPLADLAVSIFLLNHSTGNTTNVRGQQNNYVAQTAGDFTAAADLPSGLSQREHYRYGAWDLSISI